MTKTKTKTGKISYMPPPLDFDTTAKSSAVGIFTVWGIALTILFSYASYLYFG